MSELDAEPAAAAPADGPVPAPSSSDQHSVRNLVEWVGIVVGALVVALVVKTFLIQAFFIPSLSMYPTLDKGDRVLVNKLSYKLHDVHRGDLVVFERPPGQPASTIKDLIKRVVGLPGESIEARAGVVYIDGKRISEPYLVDGVTTDNLPRQTVPKGEIFVMGDNRDDSADSRVFGAIDEDSIVGRAFLRVWPIPDIGLL
ncbi:MAG: signal peptidase [Actinomycetota bacterium]|nr:signal peptidase [Actinomycetota bacterium]